MYNDKNNKNNMSVSRKEACPTQSKQHTAHNALAHKHAQNTRARINLFKVFWLAALVAVLKVSAADAHLTVRDLDEWNIVSSGLNFTIK